jgi:hypothetical protein
LDKPGSRRNGLFSENIFFDATERCAFVEHKAIASKRSGGKKQTPGALEAHFFESISGVLPFLAEHIHSTGVALLSGL